MCMTSTTKSIHLSSFMIISTGVNFFVGPKPCKETLGAYGNLKISQRPTFKLNKQNKKMCMIHTKQSTYSQTSLYRHFI